MAAGVEASDIQTSDFSIGPYLGVVYPTVEGYEIRIAYRVTMRDVEGVGSALATAVAAGGDDVAASGVRFEVDPTGLIDAVRAEAWADVEGRAEALAGLAGKRLGGVLDAHETVLMTSSQGTMEGGEGDSAGFDVPVSPGVSGVIVLLTVTFAIGE